MAQVTAFAFGLVAASLFPTILPGIFYTRVTKNARRAPKEPLGLPNPCQHDQHNAASRMYFQSIQWVIV